MGIYDNERDERLKRFEEARKPYHISFDEFKATLTHQENLADNFPEAFLFYDTDDEDAEPFENGKMYEGYMLSGSNFHYWIRKQGVDDYWVANDEWSMTTKNIDNAIESLYDYYLIDCNAEPRKAAA